MLSALEKTTFWTLGLRLTRLDMEREFYRTMSWLLPRTTLTSQPCRDHLSWSGGSEVYLNTEDVPQKGHQTRSLLRNLKPVGEPEVT